MRLKFVRPLERVHFTEAVFVRLQQNAKYAVHDRACVCWASLGDVNDFSYKITHRDEARNAWSNKTESILEKYDKSISNNGFRGCPGGRNRRHSVWFPLYSVVVKSDKQNKNANRKFL